jgi:hypothetical protein
MVRRDQTDRAMRGMLFEPSPVRLGLAPASHSDSPEGSPKSVLHELALRYRTLCPMGSLSSFGHLETGYARWLRPHLNL